MRLGQRLEGAQVSLGSPGAQVTAAAQELHGAEIAEGRAARDEERRWGSQVGGQVDPVPGQLACAHAVTQNARLDVEVALESFTHEEAAVGIGHGVRMDERRGSRKVTGCTL